MTTTLANPATAAAHAAAHLPAGADAIDWAGGIHRSGADASKPAAAASNAGEFYFATDTIVMYRSTGSAWAPISYDPTFSLLKNGAATVREGFCREDIRANSAAFTSGTMGHTTLPLIAGDVVTNLVFYTSGAATTPTAWWFALYDTQATPALMSQSADQGSAAIAATTRLTLALGAPQTITVTGLYYACFSVTAAAAPTWAAKGFTGAIEGGILATQKRLCGFSGSALGGTAPGTIASPSNAGTQVWCAAT